MAFEWSKRDELLSWICNSLKKNQLNLILLFQTTIKIDKLTLPTRSTKLECVEDDECTM